MIGRPKPAISWLEQLEQYRATQRQTSSQLELDNRGVDANEVAPVDAAPVVSKKYVARDVPELVRVAIDAIEKLNAAASECNNAVSEADLVVPSDAINSIDLIEPVDSVAEQSLENTAEIALEIASEYSEPLVEQEVTEEASVEAVSVEEKPESQCDAIAEDVIAATVEVESQTDSSIESGSHAPKAAEPTPVESVRRSHTSYSQLESLTYHIPLDPLARTMQRSRPFVLGICAIGPFQSQVFEQVVRSIALRCSAKFDRKACLVLITDAISDNSLQVDFSTPDLAEFRWRYAADRQFDPGKSSPQEMSVDAALRKKWIADVARLPTLKQTYDFVVMAVLSDSSESHERVGRLCNGTMLLLANSIEYRRSTRAIRAIQNSGIRVLGCWSSTVEPVRTVA